MLKFNRVTLCLIEEVALQSEVQYVASHMDTPRVSVMD